MPLFTDSEGKKVDMRYTGEAATCLDNSIVNVLVSGAAYFVAKLQCDGETVKLGEKLAKEMTENYEECGLIAKCKNVPLNRATFLKGVFLPDKNGVYQWIRLPSFLLKFGKVLTNPDQIIKQKIPYSVKCAMVLKGQMLGYGAMETNWFYKELRKHVLELCGSVTAVCYTTSSEKYSVMQSSAYIEVDDWNSFMLERYKITSFQMVDFLEQFKKIKELPSLYHHPLLDSVMGDY